MINPAAMICSTPPQTRMALSGTNPYNVHLGLNNQHELDVSCSIPLLYYVSSFWALMNSLLMIL